ncbi:MAG: hypothetical protein JRJ76_01605 [Deltaproteobacteria bacterium]|nr:hypothetical protein [Deltaproteobacteria bacterium]
MLTDNPYFSIYEELSKPEAHSRYEALILLGNCEQMLGIPKEKSMVLAIAPYLHDCNDHVRYYAAESLMNLGYREAIPFLKSALPVINLKEISPPPTSKGIEGVEYLIKMAISELSK